MAIDSGGDWAWAYVADGLLRGCGLKTLPDPWPTADRLVVEKPHTGRSKATAKDRITLAIRAGEAGALFGHHLKLKPEYIEPSRWKGSVDKPVMNKIVLAKLKPEELALLVGFTTTKKHNVLDAIGIALFSVGR